MDVLLAFVGLLAVLHVLYATWTARRLDRLHARVDAATAALDRQLRYRAQAALAFAPTVSSDVDGTLADVMMRTVYARRFHNDAVRDALTVRKRRIVRWFHLAGTARLPSFFEMDEATPDRRTIEV